MVGHGGNMEFPFNEYMEDGFKVREFDSNLDNSELVWHRDRTDRVVEVIENNGWLFQMDNDLPVKLEGKFYIPKNTYHRVIKGDGKLIIKIKDL